MKILRVLTILLIVTIGSGCAKDNLIEPLCLPDKPVLFNVTVAEQREIQEIDPDLLGRIGINDERLKGHINTIEELTDVHNKQFKASCVGDSE